MLKGFSIAPEFKDMKQEYFKAPTPVDIEKRKFCDATDYLSFFMKVQEIVFVENRARTADFAHDRQSSKNVLQKLDS